MTRENERLSAALEHAAKTKAARDQLAEAGRFTTESARAANAVKYAGVEKKQPTVTVRVWQSAAEASVRSWPKSERVEAVSRAILEASKRARRTI